MRTVSGNVISGLFGITMKCGHRQDYWYSGDRNKGYQDFKSKKQKCVCDKCKEVNS